MQNRPGLIRRFVGVASNILTHRLLVRTQIDEDLREYYTREIERDTSIALRYRDSINPAGRPLPLKDAAAIKQAIASRVRAELLKRIQRGYDIDMGTIDAEIDDFLCELRVRGSDSVQVDQAP